MQGHPNALLVSVTPTLVAQHHRTSVRFDLDMAPQAVEEIRDDGATLDVAGEVGEATPSAALRAVARLVDAAVATRTARVSSQLMPDDRQGWTASYALANCYKDGQESVGPHSGGPPPQMLIIGCNDEYRPQLIL